MDIEETLNSIIFFPSIKNGSFDYTTPMKSSLIKFDIDKTYEPSESLFEYLCYKIVKKKLSKGSINSETVLITEKFLTSYNCKKVFIKTKAIQKKNIIIFLQNKETSKWNLIAFLNLEEQLKNCFNDQSKQLITAKMISSNSNSDEDDFILNSTMDKLENTFDFKSPDDIQFEVDSINISDQPNTCIFLLNFIEGLIVQNDENLPLYIKKLYDEGSNTMDPNSRNYFNSFNLLGENFENIYIKYQNELNAYCRKNKNNIINFDIEKIMNGNNEIFNIESNSEINKKNEKNGNTDALANGMDKIKFENNANNQFLKDELDMIKIEQDDDIDDDLNSDEEEEALKIMERENEETKSQIREQERKLKQKIYKQKLRLKNINMYKDFGVIKEEDNESESESIDLFSKFKEEKEKNMNDNKKSIKKSIEDKKNKSFKKSTNNSKSNSENNTNIVLKTENNILCAKDNEIEKEIFDKNNENIGVEQKSKSEKSIKLSVLKDLEEAIEEFESEQDPNKNNEEKNNKKKNDIKNNNYIIENKQIEKKNSIKNESIIDAKIKEKKYINIFKENLDIKKRSSMPKIKEIYLDDKNKINERLKKTFTNTKKNDKEKNKEKSKEKKSDEGAFKNIKNNILTLKKSFTSKDNNKYNKSSKSNNIINPNKAKDQDNNSSTGNSTTNIYNTNSFNSNTNSSKSNEQDKSLKEKEISRKEPMDNLQNHKANNNTKNSSKNKNQNQKKSNSKKSNEKQSQPALLSKGSNNSQKSNSSNKSNESFNKSNGEKNYTKTKKKFVKEFEIKIDKNNITDFSALDNNPLNVLPPQKKVERNGYNVLNEKDSIENGSSHNLKSNQISDINSVQSDKLNGDLSSNINIENIFSDDFESEKDRNELKDEGSVLGESRTKKTTMSRKGDRKNRPKIPPRKSKVIGRGYNNDYCIDDEDGTNKICGCIGEQSNGICSIF